MRAHVMRVATTYRLRAIEDRSTAHLPGGVPVPAFDQISRNSENLQRFFRSKERHDEDAERRKRLRFNEDAFKAMGGAS